MAYAFSGQVRDFKAASALLLDGIATFSATELFPYSRFVLYCTMCCMLSVDRPTLAAKVRYFSYDLPLL